MSAKRHSRGQTRVYMAGPLFTTAERLHNLRLARALKKHLPNFVFVLPQQRAGRFLPDLRAVVADCLTQVKKADVLLACLDGPDADSGTCLEIGYAMALEKPVLGYRTDFRGSEADGVNAMLRYGCTRYIQAPSIAVAMRKLTVILADRLRAPALIQRRARGTKR